MILRTKSGIEALRHSSSLSIRCFTRCGNLEPSVFWSAMRSPATCTSRMGTYVVPPPLPPPIPIYHYHYSDRAGGSGEGLEGLALARLPTLLRGKYKT